MIKKSQKDKIQHYLFGEMSNQEIDLFELNFFKDDELFKKIEDMESDLIRRFIHKDLTGDESRRFEQSIINVPGREERIVEEMLLYQYSREEKTNTSPPFVGVWNKISDFLQVPRWSLQFGTLAGFLIIGVLAVFIFINYPRETELPDNSKLVAQHDSKPKKDELEIPDYSIPENLPDKSKDNENPASDNSVVNTSAQNPKKNVLEDRKNTKNDKIKDSNTRTPPPQSSIVPRMVASLVKVLPMSKGETIEQVPTAEIQVTGKKRKMFLTINLTDIENYESLLVQEQDKSYSPVNISKNKKTIVFQLSPRNMNIEITAIKTEANNERESLGFFELSIVNKK